MVFGGFDGGVGVVLVFPGLMGLVFGGNAPAFSLFGVVVM